VRDTEDRRLCHHRRLRNSSAGRKDGSIDWLCGPNFFTRLFRSVARNPKERKMVLRSTRYTKRVTRSYLDHMLILEARFETATGILLLKDFMPVRETHFDSGRTVPSARRPLFTHSTMRAMLLRINSWSRAFYGIDGCLPRVQDRSLRHSAS
jgi:hypothetical protein